jgi:protein phosphatase PTC2/3
VFPGRLSVSRTVGDIEAKQEKYEGNPNVVIADPDVTAFEIKDNHDFIVLGCDGIFDKLSSKDAIHIAWQKVLMEANKSGVKQVNLE